MYRYALTALFLCMVTTLSHAELTVQPIALTVGSPSIADMDFHFKPSGVNAGTSVQLLIGGFEKTVVDIDKENSTLDNVTDSTNKDLLEKPPAKNSGLTFTQSPIGPFPKISEEGSKLIVELITPQAPSIGATSIKYQGTLSVIVAEGTKTISANDVATEPGQVQIGDQSLEITGFGPSDWQKGKFKLSIKMTRQLLDQIASWKITAADGTVLCDHPSSTMTMNTTANLDLMLAQELDKINIAIELYDGMQKIEVPIDTKVSLGIE